MKDYSQYGEQQYILDAVGKNVSQFLDIGAYHPEVFSNTRALFELGWSGVMVEPSPRPSLSLVEAYGKESRITLIQAAVGFENGLLPLHVTDDAVSTSVESEYEKWKDAGKFHGVIHIPQITLADIANQFGGFDFVDIDAEGVSCDLFRKAIELGWRPHCWCVEVDKDRSHELDLIASGAGYITTMTSAANKVFVKR